MYVFPIFQHSFVANSAQPFQQVAFLCTLCTGLLFLIIGSFICFYARDRSIALLFYCFCYASAMKIALLEEHLVGLATWFSWLTTAVALLTLLLLLMRLILFPPFRPSFLYMRMQVYLCACSALFALAPFLIFTMMPTFLKFPLLCTIDRRFTAIIFALFPIGLSYAILRYQLRLSQLYIRRTMAWIVGLICLTILAYAALIYFRYVLVTHGISYAICVAACAVVFAPFTWWLAKVVTTRVFFSEVAYYQRIIEGPSLLEDEFIDLMDASRLCTIAAAQTFETAQVCLFVIDESVKSYLLYPPLRDDPEDDPRQILLHTLYQALHQQTAAHERAGLDVSLPLMERLARAHRCVLLAEEMGELSWAGLERFIAPDCPRSGEHVLFIPVYAQDAVIAILVLGERSKYQPYAGTDFELAQLLVSRFASIIENARLYARASKYSLLLNNLCSVSTLLDSTFKSVEETASIYGSIAAESTSASADIWLYNRQENALEQVVSFGADRQTVLAEVMHSIQERDWLPWFHEQQRVTASDETIMALRPSSLPCALPSPLAWLPLLKGELRVGLLVLVYEPPHFFLKEEMKVLKMFATQCAVALESAHMTMDLYHAYKQQTELDHLKDRFIVTASHDLRSPLTMVQGYIELLHEYISILAPEMRSTFITKARRGCDELTLMISNIMDASQPPTDIKRVRLSLVSLRNAALHVLEILEDIINREQRNVELTIAPDLFTLADDLRLRQVLLNILTNALKYSPPGTPISISTTVSDGWITVHIQDQGPGVPPAAQKQLFERFVRLERDVHKSEGSGLGLFICRELVRSMGGQIWVESSGQPGQGSIFSFTLRCEQQVPLLTANEEQQARQSPLPNRSPSIAH